MSLAAPESSLSGARIAKRLLQADGAAMEKSQAAEHAESVTRYMQ